jgi:hypothetical protein
MIGVEQPDVSYRDQLLPGRSEPVPTAVPLFVGFTQSGPQWALAEVSSLSDFEAVFGGPGTKGFMLYYSVCHFFDNGGGTAFILSLGSTVDARELDPGKLITAFSDQRIVQCVAKEERITLVSIPDMALLPDDDIDSWVDAWTALMKIGQARRGIFGILDAPDDPLNARRCLDEFVTRQPAYAEWGGAYWPRLLTDYTDESGERPVVPPSAAVAALMASVDHQFGVWRAPANIALSRVVKPTRSWLESGSLFQTSGASLNLVRSFPGNGVRVWGCRTLCPDSNSPWLYVQVRRTVAYVEAQISQIARCFVFEGNTPLTWIRLRGIVHIRLRELWLDGALYGEEEAQAFFVQIGLGETMTQDDVDEGRMIMKVGLAVAHPAEFIDVSITLDTRSSLVSAMEAT